MVAVLPSCCVFSGGFNFFFLMVETLPSPLNSTDSRRTLSVLTNEFPEVDFSQVEYLKKSARS